jgi:hypothetical protein
MVGSSPIMRHLHADLVGIDSGAVQHHHGLKPKSAADALHADGFAAQPRQRVDILAHDQLARSSFYRKSDTADLNPCRHAT